MTTFPLWRSIAVAGLLAGSTLTTAPALAQQAHGTQLAQNDDRGRGGFRERIEAARQRGQAERRESAGNSQGRNRGTAEARQAQPRSAERGWRTRSNGSAGQAPGWRGQQAQAPQQQQQQQQRRILRGQERAQNDSRWQRRHDEGTRNWNGRDRDDARRADRARNDNWRNNVSRNDNWRNGSRYGDNRYRNDVRRWNSNSWRQDRRYDWRGYRNYNRNVYHLGRYYAPYRGYSYRRLNIGLLLQPLFYSQNYWISDPWQYRLPAVYGPYRWVRYYDDVLLIDTYSGEVVDVIYNFFW